MNPIASSTFGVNVVSPRSAFLLICLVSGITPTSFAQTTTERPHSPIWLAANVGLGTAYIGNSSASGLGGDVALGGRVRNIRIGGRLVGVSTASLVGDQPGWSGRTALAFGGYDFADGLFSLTIGAGVMRVRQRDSAIRGRSKVLETGVDVCLAGCSGASLRIFALRTWALGTTRWEGASAFGDASQFQLGVGFRTG
jgi:hypothetical protein